jgi:hypothetical protein
MPHDEDLIEAKCDAHGLDRHVLIHEAGHAVAAIDHGIQFRAIVLYGVEGGPTLSGELQQAAAGVDMMSDDPADWVLPDTLAALRFVLAGALSETAILGHAIEASGDEDIILWRRPITGGAVMAPEDLNSHAGGDFNALIDEVDDWAASNAGRIERVASRLAELEAPAELAYQHVVVLVT